MQIKKSHLIALAVVVLIVGYYVFKVVSRPEYTLPAGERPFKGRADAQVVIDEYSDFQCPACRGAVAFVNSLDEKYGANIRINYNHFPLTSIHQYAVSSAIASECGNDQGKFWEMHDAIFSYQQAGQNNANLRKAAEDAGLDLAQYDACMANKARKDVVAADQKKAAELGLNSTPSFLLNGKLVQDRSQLEPAIRALLGLPAEEVTK